MRAENRQLKEQIEQMRLEQVRLSEDAAQARRLQNLLAFKEQFVSKTVAAQVIGSGGSDLSRIVYIDKGEQDGLKSDMAVITADGVVGKVLQVFRTPSVSQVLLISDQSSGVGAILEKSRLQGVLRGTANGEVVLERVMSDEQVQAGETVLTSGGDQIFPKGLPVGTVTRVGSGKDLFLSIKIKPAANLSKLEEVLVLVEKQERQAVAEDKGVRLRAADILAQRLPSVPDKPPTDPTAKPTAERSSPATNAKPETKPANSGTSPVTKTAVSPVRPAGTTATGSASVTSAIKPKATTAAASAPAVKTEGAADNQPSITEQKPPATPSAEPNSQPPADDNSPH